MEVSYFLAKVFGLYLLIMSSIFLLKGEKCVGKMKELTENQGVSLLSAVITLIMGIVLVVSHSLWVMDWRILITLLCWLVFLKGLARLWCSEIDKKLIRILDHKMLLKGVMLIYLALGLFLIYMGYYS